MPVVWGGLISLSSAFRLPISILQFRMKKIFTHSSFCISVCKLFKKEPSKFFSLYWKGNYLFLYENFYQQKMAVCCCLSLSLLLLFSHCINCFYAFVAVGKSKNTYLQAFLSFYIKKIDFMIRVRIIISQKNCMATSLTHFQISEIKMWELTQSQSDNKDSLQE